MTRISVFIFFSIFIFIPATIPAKSALSYWKARQAGGNALKALRILRAGRKEDPRSYNTQWQFIRAAQYYGEFFLTKESKRLALYLEAIAAGEAAVALRPDGVEGHFWLGTACGLYAGVRGGIRSISYVNRFRVHLERAVVLNPFYENGAPLNTLGMLYFKAPGWPFSFGDNKKALQLLRRSLAGSRPNPVVNRLLAEVLLKVEGPEQALPLIKAALAMPIRPGYLREDKKVRGELLLLRKRIP